MAGTAAQARINGLKGGRKKGGKNASTLLREVVKKDFDQKVLRLQNRLLNAQASKAIGQQFLYKIEKEFVRTGENKDVEEKGYWKNLPPKLVDTEEEIFEYLNMLAENNGSVDDDQSEESTYYYITAKEPDNNAIDSLLNRVHGKATESINVDVDVKFSLKSLAQRRQSIGQTEQKIIDAVSKPVDASVDPAPEPSL